MFGITDNEFDFKIKIFNKEYSLNTSEEKREFAFALFTILTELKKDRDEAVWLNESIQAQIDTYYRRND